MEARDPFGVEKRLNDKEKKEVAGVAAVGAVVATHGAARKVTSNAGYVKYMTKDGTLARQPKYYGYAHPKVRAIANTRGGSKRRLRMLMKDHEAMGHLHRDLASPTPSRSAMKLSNDLHPNGYTNPAIRTARGSRAPQVDLLHDPSGIRRSKQLLRVKATKKMLAHPAASAHGATLYRGVRGVEHNVGDTVDFGHFSSFTSNRKIAHAYASQHGMEKKGVYRVVGGKATPLDGTGGRSRNHEWLAGGKHRVVAKIPHPGASKGRGYYEYHVEPVNKAAKSYLKDPSKPQYPRHTKLVNPGREPKSRFDRARWGYIEEKAHQGHADWYRKAASDHYMKTLGHNFPGFNTGVKAAKVLRTRNVAPVAVATAAGVGYKERDKVKAKLIKSLQHPTKKEKSLGLAATSTAAGAGAVHQGYKAAHLTGQSQALILARDYADRKSARHMRAADRMLNTRPKPGTKAGARTLTRVEGEHTAANSLSRYGDVADRLAHIKVMKIPRTRATAVALAGTAAGTAYASHKVKKSMVPMTEDVDMAISAFGVDHGEISKVSWGDGAVMAEKAVTGVRNFFTGAGRGVRAGAGAMPNKAASAGRAVGAKAKTGMGHISTAFSKPAVKMTAIGAGAGGAGIAVGSRRR